MPLTLRATKGVELTDQEMDDNFSGLASGANMTLPFDIGGITRVTSTGLKLSHAGGGSGDTAALLVESSTSFIGINIKTPAGQNGFLELRQGTEKRASVEIQNVTSSVLVGAASAGWGTKILYGAGSSGLEISSTGSVAIPTAGPHAIGGATNSAVQLGLLGTLAGGEIGINVENTLSPASDRPARGVLIQPTLVEAGGGTHADFMSLEVRPPTITAGAAALANASTVKITGAPTGATNNYALWNIGLARFDGSIRFQAGAAVSIGTFDTQLFDIRTDNTFRARFDTAGNLKLAGTASRATTEGTNHLDIFDGTAPVGTLTNGISLYSTAGELRVMDAAGNATLLSPHSQDGRWIHDEVNYLGRRLRVDMEGLLTTLNDSFGLDFIESSDSVVTAKLGLVARVDDHDSKLNELLAWKAKAETALAAAGITIH